MLFFTSSIHCEFHKRGACCKILVYELAALPLEPDHVSGDGINIPQTKAIEG